MSVDKSQSRVPASPSGGKGGLASWSRRLLGPALAAGLLATSSNAVAGPPPLDDPEDVPAKKVDTPAVKPPVNDPPGSEKTPAQLAEEARKREERRQAQQAAKEAADRAAAQKAAQEAKANEGKEDASAGAVPPGDTKTDEAPQEDSKVDEGKGTETPDKGGPVKGSEGGPDNPPATEAGGGGPVGSPAVEVAEVNKNPESESIKKLEDKLDGALDEIRKLKTERPWHEIFGKDWLEKLVNLVYLYIGVLVTLFPIVLNRHRKFSAGALHTLKEMTARRKKLSAAEIVEAIKKAGVVGQVAELLKETDVDKAIIGKMNEVQEGLTDLAEEAKKIEEAESKK